MRCKPFADDQCQPRLRHFFKRRGLNILKQAQPAIFVGKEKDFEQHLLSDYIRAHSIISSRTFIVDMYHGMCLAPIADMYNHSGDASVHFEADDEVCDECGSLGACPHNDDPLPSIAYGRPSAFLPAISGPNSQDWVPPIELQGVDTVDMVAQQDLNAEEEAYNTYGNFSNANLLTIYGFCLEYETEWERYVWEWRNKEEREELLSAMGIHLTQRRKLADEQIRIADWVKTCVAYTNLPQSSFDELLFNSFPLPQMKVEDPSTTITLPVFSPYVALTQSATQEGVDTTLEEPLEDVITPLSTHDGSKDSQQPLYIDHQGRVSLSLWRAVLLFSLTAEDRDAKEESTRVRQRVRDVERMFSKVVTLGGDSVEDNTDEKDSRQVLHKSLMILQALVSRRLETIKAIRDCNGVDDLSFLEVRGNASK
jgi:hypothetical protein